jgi:iron(III) transport system substrate-binding protein
MVLVDTAGLFAPLPADILSQVREPFRPADGRWVGVAARSTVFAYNKNRLTPAQLPKSLLDLADPAWKGRWGASPAGADFQAIVSALLEMKGEAETATWLKAMKQNAVAFRGNVAALKAVNSGEIEGAVIYQGGQDILRTGDSYEYAVGVGAESNPKLVPLADLQAPTVDPSKLNGKKVIELMMQAGLL